MARDRATRPLATFARATRAKTLPVLLVPAGTGAAFGWMLAGRLDAGGLAVVAVAAAAGALGHNLATDFFEDAAGADAAARGDRASIPSGSGLLAEGGIGTIGALALAGSLLAAALGFHLAVGVVFGWGVAAFGVGALVAGFLYAAPPAQLAWRGRGLGEAGAFAAYGWLPFVWSAGVQTAGVRSEALAAGVVPGLLLALVFLNTELLHWRSDRVVGKRTLAAVAGPDAAIAASGGLAALAGAVLAIETALGIWPWSALVALAALVPFAAAWARARADSIVQNCLQLLGATLGAVTLAGAILFAALAAEALR